MVLEPPPNNIKGILQWLIILLSIFRTVLEFDDPGMTDTGAAAFFKAVLRFLIMFFGSSVLGIVSGLVSAMVSFGIFDK